MIWVVFGIMLLAGTLVVALPMVRHERRFGMLPVSAILAVAAIAVAVYAQIGSPGAATGRVAGGGSAAAPDIDAMVAGLVQRLAANPDDVAGWNMLGRSYVQLQRYGEAVHAFEQALERGPQDDAQTLANLGEAILLDTAGPVAGRAAQLFETALAAAPGNPKALFYGGIAAIERGDRAAAADRWEALLASSPPPEVQDILRQRIAEWRGAAPPAPADAGPVATVTVSLGAGIMAPDDATVFIIARDPTQPSPPIAAVRRQVGELPDTVTLGDADAMIPGRLLSAYTQLEIVARVSMSGGPIEQPGDWYGTMQLDTDRGRAVAVVIDRKVE